MNNNKQKINRCIQLFKRAISTLNAYEEYLASSQAEVLNEMISELNDQELCFSIIESEYAFIHMSDTELASVLAMAGYPEEHVQAAVKQRKAEAMDIAALRDPLLNKEEAEVITLNTASTKKPKNEPLH